MSKQEDDTAFENEVRRIARWLYPGTDGQGAMSIAGRERDAILVNDDVAVAIEATVSRNSAKARSDAEKLIDSLNYLRATYPDRPAQAFFITSSEPSDQQRDAVERVAGQAVTCMSLDVFRSRLVDVGEYLTLRDLAPFGSARDPADDQNPNPGDYSPIDLLDLRDQSTHTVDGLTESIRAGKRWVLLGDYGAGKSMTLREVYFSLVRMYRSGTDSYRFPLYLNMREHQAQTDPVEAIERHARKISYPRPDKLVRAWRSGMCHLLIDGFDEIYSPPLAGVSRDADSLRELNYQAVELVRAFVRESPSGPGLAVNGRTHYFASQEDLLTALDLDSDTPIYSLSDFSAGQMRQYLSRHGWSTDVPEWVPRRPLLLGWLASRGHLQSAVDANHLSPADGWDWLLGVICRRDARVEGGIPGDLLRQVLERIATNVRHTANGLGPVYVDDLRSAFRDVMKYPPNEKQEVLLRRFPGLIIDNPSTGSKRFIDADVAQVARAGDISRYVMSPSSFLLDSKLWMNLLGPLGTAVSAALLEKVLQEKASGAINHALTHASRRHQDTLVVDLFFLALELDVTDFDFRLTIREVILPEFRLGEDEANLGSVEFQDCIIERLEIGNYDNVDKLPKFWGCEFVEIDGVARYDDLPPLFNDCKFGSFSREASTTNALVNLNLPRGLRLGLVILRKVHAQKGAGRKDTALRKGIPPQERQYVNAVLDVLASARLVYASKRGSVTVWLPVKSQYPRVRKWLSSPETARDDVVDKLRSI
ncbi:hypothetical protein GCM10009557_14780 [Virgisporangium ochraceum]|uniref:NACHT domain-containing protein n=1 Tax=Virgisporangium ochraceum TaxID=65505 RepID=A0A8J3ZLJ9_9ACTN|nr:hypothetical protein [Virgisporangium ochraceum]GIJ66302.1 hypothetical protein Voc01_012190 [Virgisporangium ochraceum]